MALHIESFFDKPTFSASHVVVDTDARVCAVIDPVLGYKPNAGRTNTESADKISRYVESNGLKAEWIIDTHVHADHLSAMALMKERLGGRTGIGEHVREVQERFRAIFNASDVTPDGAQFDHLFKDGERFRIGGLDAEVLATPGHTSDSVSYHIGDALFVGDTMFMPDYGTARCDFPGGDAETLFRSLKRLFAFPPETRIFLCHDYGEEIGRAYAWETTVGAQRAGNIHVKDGVTAEQFIEMRTTRDKKLDLPNLILVAVQVNMRAGHLPPPESNGVSYAKIPLNQF